LADRHGPTELLATTNSVPVPTSALLPPRDFVHLAFSEIRSCGSNNLQIVRRLRAMIQNLLQTLPPHRHAALHQELSLLDREIEKNFAYPDELALAWIADTQGLGGHSGKHVAASA